ncbi:hypothetical protein ACHAXR_008521 [Thalassiosira sp. AJA248-18]
MTMALSSRLRKAAAALLLCICHHHEVVADRDHASADHASGIQEFIPPKLSFTAADYFASLESDNVVNSVQQHSDNNNDGHYDDEVVPWTIFQGAPTAQQQAAIQRRSGPLLTLFPDTNAVNNKHAKHAVLIPAEQRLYLATHAKDCHSDSILERYDLFVESPTLANLATELWKYCALYTEGGIYVDAETAPLAALGDVLNWDTTLGSSSIRENYVVVADTQESGVSPLLLNDDSTISDSVTTASSLGTGKPVAISSVLAIATKQHSVPAKMMAILMDTSIEKLEEDALLLPTMLMGLIQEDEMKEDGRKWGLFKQRCNGIDVAGGGGGSNNNEEEHRTLRHCPASAGYCCEVLDPQQNFVFLLSRQALVPNQILPHPSTLPQPFNNMESDSTTMAEDDKLPFLSTVHEESSSPLLTQPFTPGSSDTTPNIYELLTSMDALPNQESNKQQCMDCLREKKAADCTLCAKACPNFCENICELDVAEKPVKKVLSVVGPRYRKDPERLIPRIVHQLKLRVYLTQTSLFQNDSRQTWFEPVTPEKYPNMSRLIESWKRSGWQYNFWDDASAAEFLSLHFPPEVREAYDSILPGAFKADLFRYCVLLIEGGIYADMDVMLESNLDAAVPPDVGFMVPVDAPGSKPDHRMCLWNGFIASAPAHPYLSRVIEHVVNNIRNRFTVVDYDHMMCPDPELSVVHAFSTLFTAGPCILGLTVNEVMGRELQQTFVEGDLDKPSGINVENFPGRTIILQQNKWDMGAHRFTWVENNLVVAATDMPDYDDRKDLEGEDEEQATHYSKTLDRNNLYGQDKVYVNREIAHERIVIKTKASFPVSSVA